jgi:uncharacterized membrane protein (UPF0127 family)
MDASSLFLPLPLSVRHARGFWSRLSGLIGTPELRKGEALLLAPCRSVHTWFMSYRIDVVFVDRAGGIVRVATDLAPWRIVSCIGAHAVLELRAGEAARYGLRPGESLAAALRCGGSA